MNTLIVGCGLKPKPGCVNLDRVPLPGVDCVFDLDTIKVMGNPYTQNLSAYEGRWAADVLQPGSQPWRLPYLFNHFVFLTLCSAQFDRVEAEDVLEHVDRPIDVVQELGRVLRKGGVLWVRGPDAEWVWHDLTHKRAFSERTFDGFDPESWDGRQYGHYHGPIKFRMVEKRLFNHGWEYTLEKR